MNRVHFQKIARMRLEEAESLMKTGNCSGAYYLAGYTVECALKACIAKNTKDFDFPPKPQIVRDIYVHDLVKLVKAAGLEDILNEARQNDQDLDENWKTVEDWSEESRYEIFKKSKTEALLKAISDKSHGVLQWISTHW